jgi:hypothetical protein
VVVFSLFVAAAASVAARPPAQGVSSRVRMVITPPDMPGMAMSPMTVVGHGVSIGSQSRLEIDSVSGQMPLAVGDYILTLDSGRTVVVNPATKSYTEGFAGLMSIPPEILSQASIGNVNVTTENLGAGEAMYGFATEKARMTMTYSMTIMGTGINNMTVAEMWLTQLPANVSTPFDGNLPKELSEGVFKELADKLNAARKQFGTKTALKTVTTSSVTGPMNATTNTSVELLDVKVGDVDASLLKVPEGFTKKP